MNRRNFGKTAVGTIGGWMLGSQIAMGAMTPSPKLALQSLSRVAPIIPALEAGRGFSQLIRLSELPSDVGFQWKQSTSWGEVKAPKILTSEESPASTLITYGAMQTAFQSASLITNPEVADSGWEYQNENSISCFKSTIGESWDSKDFEMYACYCQNKIGFDHDFWMSDAGLVDIQKRLMRDGVAPSKCLLVSGEEASRKNKSSSFQNFILSRPPRFRRNGDKFEEIHFFKMDQGACLVNADYENATHEKAVIFHPDVMDRMVPNLSNPHGVVHEVPAFRAKLTEEGVPEVDEFGEIVFEVDPDRSHLRADLMAAWRPKMMMWGYEIMHRIQ